MSKYMRELLDAVEAAAEGDSNDAEIEALRDALEGALAEARPVEGLSESDAFGVLRVLAADQGWTVAVWSMSDVKVYTDEEWAADDARWLDEPLGRDLTQPMRDAVSCTWEWRKGIVDTANERAQGMIPEVILHDDGSFTVATQGHEDHYLADGTGK